MSDFSRLLAFILITSSCLIAGSAQAGYRYDGSVVVGSTYAGGSVRDARDNSGSVEYIGCSYEARQSGGGYFYCSARSGSGAYMSCYQYSPSERLLSSIQSINDSSYVEFRKDSSNRCTMVIVRNFSYFL